MDMMDTEKLRKRQSLKVIVSEAIMVLAVVIMVTVLALIVSGYWLGSDFKVERQGMIQVASIPTGADLDIDGQSSWLQRTNTSKVLASGPHTVTISKEGYDTWSREINISEGLLYRLHYPRLFLKDRTPEKILDISGALQATISPARDKLLLVNGTTEWQLVKLKDDTLEPKELDISEFFSNTSLADGAKVGLFTGKILTMDWDRSGSHVLFKVDNTGSTEWILLDVDNIKNTINLTKEFGADFDIVEILDNSSSNLIASQDGNLRKIDVPGKSISAVLAEEVFSFDHYENEIVYSSAGPSNTYLVSLLKIGDDESTQLETTTEPVKVAISKFYDDMYITALQDTTLKLYKKVDFTPVSEYQLTFSPEIMEVGHNGEFITMYSGAQLATLDMEAATVVEWTIDGDTFGWLDNDMIYSVADGELFVYDFNGLNRRALAKNVSSHFPAAITDDKWLYYVSDGNLTRERITK
ncbi:MAG: PEGA domain-containing protein [Candidatus Saccharibacteria bacterium]|nr:PEGA domain-containing protein [Candidatus Saccharibacteria bacterium]